MRKRFYIFSRFSETNRDLDPTPESHTFTLCLVAETNLLFLFTFCNPIKNPTLQSTTKKHHYEPSIWIGMGPFPNSIFFFFLFGTEKKLILSDNHNQHNFYPISESGFSTIKSFPLFLHFESKTEVGFSKLESIFNSPRFQSKEIESTG